VVDYD